MEWRNLFKRLSCDAYANRRLEHLLTIFFKSTAAVCYAVMSWIGLEHAL